MLIDPLSSFLGLLQFIRDCDSNEKVEMQMAHHAIVGCGGVVTSDAGPVLFGVQTSFCPTSPSMLVGGILGMSALILYGVSFGIPLPLPGA